MTGPMEFIEAHSPGMEASLIVLKPDDFVAIATIIEMASTFETADDNKARCFLRDCIAYTIRDREL